MLSFLNKFIGVNRAENNSVAIQNTGSGNIVIDRRQKEVLKIQTHSNFNLWLHYDVNHKFSRDLSSGIKKHLLESFPHARFFPETQNSLHIGENKLLFHDDRTAKNIRIFSNKNEDGINIIILDSNGSFSAIGMLAEHNHLAPNTIVLSHDTVSRDCFSYMRSIRKIKSDRGQFVEYSNFKEAYLAVENFAKKFMSKKIEETFNSQDYDYSQLLFVAFFVLEQSTFSGVFKYLQNNISEKLDEEEAKNEFRLLIKEKKLVCLNKKWSRYSLEEAHKSEMKRNHSQLVLFAEDCKMNFKNKVK